MATDAHGFCMKCKTYVPIKDPVEMLMRNGRTRVAGYCSAQGCTGRISKIVSWIAPWEWFFNGRQYEWWPGSWS